MDPLSDLLSLLRPSGALSSRLDAGGRWAIRFGGQPRHIKSYVVLRGNCWLLLEGRDQPERLEQGDCLVLPSGGPFRLMSNADVTPVSAAALFPAAGPGGTVTLADGDQFSMLVSRFEVSGRHAAQLLHMLPPVVRLQQHADQTTLRWAVERSMHELRSPQPGSELITQDLAHMTLVLALRAQLAARQADATGWFFALGDPPLHRAISAMHAAPAQRWTLHELGRASGMSRSVFALRFKTAVGETPMQYLTRWRMLLACDRLEHGHDPVAIIAQSLGYESESAFSTAFRRFAGCSPRQYARRGSASGEANLDPQP